MIGSKKPYLANKIHKIKCPCGKASSQQWNCCAIKNRWVAVCAECDIAMNEMVLAFFRIPERAKLLSRYRRKMNR